MDQEPTRISLLCASHRRAEYLRRLPSRTIGALAVALCLSGVNFGADGDPNTLIAPEFQGIWGSINDKQHFNWWEIEADRVTHYGVAHEKSARGAIDQLCAKSFLQRHHLFTDSGLPDAEHGTCTVEGC